MLRYIVERIADGVFLELELPVDVDSAGRKLGGAGPFSGTVAPDVGGLRDAAGTLLIDPYATYIHEEADGQIRGTWLVTRSEMDGEQWKIEGAGFSSYFAGRPFEGEYRGVQVDPVAVARHVVEHAQSFAGADAGITLVGSSTVRVGTDSDLKVDAAQAAVDAAKSALDVAKSNLKSAQDDAKANPTSGNKALVVTRKTQRDNAQAVKRTRDEALSDAKQKASEDGGAWKILWWDTPDCFDAFTEAIEEAQCEWYEWSGWSQDRSKVLKEIRVVTRVGRKQDSLSFVEGDNIVEAVVVEDDSGLYANTVVAIGAGEGRDALRVTVAKSDNRRRKPFVLDAKHVTKKAALQKLAEAELKARTQRLRIEAVRVDTAHVNAQRGTFGVGDTILVVAEVGWIGRQKLWRRIQELEWVDLDVADLMLGDA